ncbi:BNR-repeat neuraminidase N-terminal domain-containing protein [Fodinibius sediminis]|uniref:BNR-repeat neuraminidase N-terminal domain-containing protein n=1 Tax=Fodinibius sediminis TaxID=1214077 RepID=UPI00163D6201|nr:BNR-repeat neuraminidase N-terminal domain-containing protein [Fodinibius sediminis]
MPPAPSNDANWSVSLHQKVTPVLRGREHNPMMRILVDGAAGQGSPAVQSIGINTKGSSNIGDISAVEIFYTAGVQPSGRTLSSGVPGRRLERLTLPVGSSCVTGRTIFGYPINFRPIPRCLTGWIRGLNTSPWIVEYAWNRKKRLHQ